jgi:N12 class adenine-specific DNA methylase
MENSIDYKLGKISSDIDSLMMLHKEEKKIRDDNHTKIEEIVIAMTELKQIYMRLDSWKNGQTIYMHETTEKSQKLELKVENYKDNFEKRLTPLEDDLRARREDSMENKKGWLTTKLGVAQVIIIAVLIAFLTNLGNIWHSFLITLNK